MSDLQLGKIRDFSLPSCVREVRPFLDLRVAIIVAIPLGNFSRGREPELAVPFRVADKSPQQQRAKRPPADERMIAPHHELRIGCALFVQTIEAIFPPLQQITRRSAGTLITRAFVSILK